MEMRRYVKRELMTLGKAFGMPSVKLGVQGMPWMFQECGWGQIKMFGCLWLKISASQGP